MKEETIKNVIYLLFQAKILKEIPRSGFHFLGAGSESVAEHSFITTFIAFVMSKLEPDVDALKLISMCLVHDLLEARTGDLNYVQKKYVTPDDNKALSDTIKDISFGSSLSELINSFNENNSKESNLAHDADQIALILELKTISDVGHTAPQKWLPEVSQRIKTDTGKKLLQSIMETQWDEWWMKFLV